MPSTDRTLGICMLLLAAVAGVASASFASSPGFSGRVADCSACHRPPLHGDDAKIVVHGLPSVWAPGETSNLEIRVEGGPATIPGGPMAGFEIESLSGNFVVDEDEGVRSFYAREATYTEQGVFQRQWNVSWQAPGLLRAPQPVTFWLAGIAANGNHNVALNTSDLGEHGDSVATLVVEVPPSAAAMEAWRSMPLRPPVVEEITPTPDGILATGRLGDKNATELHYKVGTGWQTREVTDSWRILTNAQSLELRSAGSDRMSPAVEVGLPETREANAIPFLVPIGVLCGLVLARRRIQ